MRIPSIAIAALAGAAVAASAGAARAADTVIATTPRPTAIDAYDGRVVWSSYDPSIDAYRLTEWADGSARALPVPPRGEPFDVDLGPDARGATLAVYSRCRREPRHAFELDGRHGCDLYAYSFASGREFRIPGANSGADEYYPAVWKTRVAFTRAYKRDHGARRLLYWRPFAGPGDSQRLKRGPTAPEHAPGGLDLRGRRVPFVWLFDYGGQVRLDATTGSEKMIARIPGSGAALNERAAYGPTMVGDRVYWLLSNYGEAGDFSEIWRYDLSRERSERASTRIPRPAVGFVQDGSTSYFVALPDLSRPGSAPYEIHRRDGLRFAPIRTR